MFFAHSTARPDKSDWQPLEEHLSNVADMASVFASPFNAGEWAKSAGWLHDLGKYSEKFQKRLEGVHEKANHSSAGAIRAKKVYGDFVGKLLAYTITGHHGGLLDGGGSQYEEKSLLSRLSKEIPPLPDDFIKIPLPATLASPFPPTDYENQGFLIGFFVRALYSCLVDADFLDTERFLNQEKHLTRGDFLSVQGLLPLLKAHLGKFESPKGEINIKRAEVLRNCLEKADEKPGLFSLTVPTGGGKTLSSMAFALRHAVKHSLDRVIYVIPYTSIIEQNAKVFRDIFGEEQVVEHHSNYLPPNEGDEDETSITYNRQKLAAENWDAPIVVTTNVQFFESLFAARPSRCRKIHNIARSVVVLDEAQMLPTGLLSPCVLALRELTARYGTTVVLCTATQPALRKTSNLTCGFEEGEVKEIIENPQKLYAALKRVEVRREGILTDDELAKHLASHRQALCVVNTRTHARELFQKISLAEGATHLSALMTPSHRTEKISEIKEKLKAGKPCLVVSTQLIEAGVDVDFPAVYRAETGIDSVAQAAGRCNRENKLPQKGEVIVFTPEKGIPPGDFRRRAEVAKMTARKFDDLLSLEAVDHYFKELYFFEGKNGLDEKGIIEKFEADSVSLNFPFATVAREFRLIENEMESLIIQRGEKAKGLVDKLRYAEYPMSLARKLQPYTIQIYRNQLSALLAAGAVETIGDSFFVLTNTDLYDENLGLFYEDPTFRSPDKNLF